MEYLRRVLGGLRPLERAPLTEPETEKTIRFFDLTEEEGAKKLRLERGYYFSVSPITPLEFKDSVAFFNQFAPLFFQILRQNVKVEPSGRKIPVDTQGGSTDPAFSWAFQILGMVKTDNKGEKALLIAAARQDTDVAQSQILSLLNNNKRKSIR